MEPRLFTSRTQAALFYADKGFKVLPLNCIENGKCSCGKNCTSPGKHPLTKNGLKDATGDKKQIAEWFNQNPNANIGIRTGEESGFFVIDLDKKPGIDGEKAFENIIKRYGKLPKTAGQKTGSGGSHLILKYPEFEIRNTTDLVVDGIKQKGIDIRGQDGYIVAAPSNHISGGMYEFFENPIAKAPDWLLKVLKEKDSVKSSGSAKNTIQKAEPKTLTGGESKEISEALQKEWGTDKAENATSHRPIIEGVSVLFKRNGIPREDAEAFLLNFNQNNPCVDGQIHDPNDIQKYVSDCYNRDYRVTRDLSKSLIAAILKAFEGRNRIEIIISKSDNLKGRIYNGEDGRICIVREVFDYDDNRHKRMNKDKPIMKEKESVIFHYKGYIREPVIFNGKAALRFGFNGEESILTINDAITALRQRFSLAQSKVQEIRELFDAWVEEAEKSGKMVEIPLSPIYVKDGIIKCDPTDHHDLKRILEALSDYQDKATSPDGFRVCLGFNLPTPIFADIKERSQFITQTPYLIFPGLSHTGKTPIIETFVGQGYGQTVQKYYFGKERVKSAFMLSKHLQQDNLPKNIDEIDEKWLLTHVDELKNYSQTRYFSDRGRGDQSHNEYLGLSALNFSTNSNMRVDGDLGISNRFITVRFGPLERSRVDKASFLKFRDSLPQGFMFDIFKEVFAEKPIDDIIKDVGKFEFGHEWVNYVLDLINAVCRKYGIKEFRKYDPKEDFTDTNAMEIAQEFIAEWDRVNQAEEKYNDFKDEKTKIYRYRSKIEGAFKVEIKKDRTHIFFTPSALKILTAPLKLPYSNASDFINNIKSSDDGVKAENEGRTKSKKLGSGAVYVYEISIKNISEVLP